MTLIQTARSLECRKTKIRKRRRRGFAGKSARRLPCFYLPSKIVTLTEEENFKFQDNRSVCVAVPVLQSLLLADHVYRDQSTGKHVICGVFSTIFFTPNQPPIQTPPWGDGVAHIQPGHPGSGADHGGGRGSERGPNSAPDEHTRSQPIQNLMQAGSPYVYFSVTELIGKKIFEVQYVDLHDNRSLFKAEVPIECDDPLKTIEVTLPLPRLPLVALEERSYALEVLCEGQLLGSHRVLARMTPGSSPPNS